MDVKIAIQGIEGSFHSQAARKLVRTNDVELVACDSFQDVFKSIENDQAAVGVVAIENSLHGSINAVYRLLERHNLWIAGETTLKINQYLIARRPMELAQLKKQTVHVLSQAPALAQVELWLDANLPNALREETQDTALSIRTVVKGDDDSMLAVGSSAAAKLYGGSIIAGPINDDPHNYTRFVKLQKEILEENDANRTSIILKTDHTPGALLNALQAFASQNINLSKLDSHPIAGDARHYAFYIDYEAGVNTIQSRTAISILKNHGFRVKVLGSYHV